MSFSVVIPLYNKALHIERAVKSVLHQTYQEFEIVVVNDGSTDCGRDVVENIHDTRLRLINQSNQGASAARNRGIEAANHHYIAFLDADDEWQPNYLEEVQILISNFPSCGGYATAVKTIRPNGSIFFPQLACLPSSPWIGIIPNIFKFFITSISGFIPSSMVVPKRILKEVGGFPEGVNLMEDIACWIAIGMSNPIAINTKRLVIYHQDASNRSDVHKNFQPPPFLGLVSESIKKGELIGMIKVDAEEFLAQQSIFVAMVHVANGNKNEALKFLRISKNTKRFRSLWLWWRFLSIFPFWLLKFSLQVKQSLRDIL